MVYLSGDYADYPGSDQRALTEDFAKLTEFAGKLGVKVTHNSEGSFFNPATRRINIDTKTPNGRGFVSLGQLTDEYLHAWNQFRGRGIFLDELAAKEHVSWGRIATGGGTKALGKHANVAFHKLEVLNFINSGDPVPSFIWKIDSSVVRQFGYSWIIHQGVGARV